MFVLRTEGEIFRIVNIVFYPRDKKVRRFLTSGSN